MQSKLRSRVGWLTAAVASSIAWPRKDVWIQYEGDDFILRGTENGEQASAPAISTPCDTGQVEKVLAKVYRFSSVLGWFLGGYVDVVEAMSGSHALGFGAQMRQAFSTVGQFGDKAFSCNHMPIVDDEKVRIALAFWRDGERLTRVHDSYAFLSYYKVIESQFKKASARVDWINQNINLVSGRAAARVEALRSAGEDDVGRHLWESGRNAVAHASMGGAIVDPDIPSDRRRITADLVVIRELARRIIDIELKVPTAAGLFARRDRLAPWDGLIDSEKLAVLRAGGTPSLPLGLEGRRLSVALWPDQPMDGLANMVVREDEALDGVVRIVAFNARMTVVLVFLLDYRNGHIQAHLEQSGLLKNDENAPVEQDVREFYTFFHRVIGNAVVELRLGGVEPVDCDIVIPVNILPRNATEAAEEAVLAFRRQQGQQAGPADAET